MSIGCGTLCSPSGFNKGTANASSSNGRQHNLPESREHRRINQEDIEKHWTLLDTDKPTLLPSSITATWQHGEHWNIDSNIRRWGEHEVRRNAAAMSYDVHRHDAIRRTFLQSRSGEKELLKTIDLEALGFDLGARNRDGDPAPKDERPCWRPPSVGEQFRSDRSYNRNKGRLREYYRSLRKTASAPTWTQYQLPMPEDVGGEAGELVNAADLSVERAGCTFGSRSCSGWDGFDHTVKREGAKLGLSVHAPALRGHEAHPWKDDGVAPAAIYTRRFKKGGEQALRAYEPRNVRLPMS